MGRNKNLSESLRYIYEHFGVETFQNEKTIYSVLSDLIPKEKMEINWVVDAINTGAIKPLIEAEKQNLNREEQKKKSRNILEANEIGKFRIDYLLNCFSYGLKWTDKIISMEEIKAQEKKANSKTNTTEKTVKKQTIKKEENTIKNINQKQNVNQKKTATITKDKIQKLEYDLDSIYQKVDNIVQFNRNSILQIKPLNLFGNGFISVFIFIACVVMMASYLFVLKEGYIYKKMLVLDIFGVFYGICLLKGTFKNLKALKSQLTKKRIYNKYVDLKGAIGFTLKNVQSGSVLTMDGYNSVQTLIKDYNMRFNQLQNDIKKITAAKKEENKSIIEWSVLFIVIFIISGIFEPRLVYDHDTIFHKVSRSVVELANDKLYDSKTGCVQTDAANIRRKPDTDSEIIDVLEKYEKMYLTGKSYTKDDKVWYETSLYNEKGWISSSVIDVVPNRVIVTESAANIRTRGNLNSDVAAVVTKGDKFYTTGRAIVRTERTWYEIYLNGEDGYWISSNVVQETE